MPLPLIPILLGAAALGAAGYGAKKGYDGVQDSNRATEYYDEGKSTYKRADTNLKTKRDNAQEAFRDLGRLQVHIINTSFVRFEEFNDELDLNNQVSIGKVLDSGSLDKLRKVRQELLNISTAVGGLLAAGGSGALAGFGAFGGAGLLATASTGTAISSLSGVAATNATLAWFGGGSLAAGRLGMAGGTMVIGGVVAAPIIAVAGAIFAASAEKKKYDAMAFRDSINEVAESMRAEGSAWDEILNASKEKIKNLRELDSDFEITLDTVGASVQRNGKKINTWPSAEQEVVKYMIQTALTIQNTINNPIMSDNDSDTKRIMSLQNKHKDLMSEINRRWGSK